MATISIDYSSLHNAVTQAGRLSNALSSYQSQISSTVDSRLKTLSSSGDSRGYISAAEQKANAKMTTMTNKSAQAATFKKKLDDFVTLAEDADKNTAKKIATLGDAAVGKRSTWEKVGDWIYNTFCVDLVNKLPVISAIANVIKGAWRKAGNVVEDIITWFKYKGGKYVWNIVLTVVSAVVAIVSAVTAVVTAGTAFAIAVAVASIIFAVIAVVNGAIAICNNVKAITLYNEGKIGQSRYYGSIDGFSDAVSKYDMGDTSANKRWKFAGIGMDTVEIICGIVVSLNKILSIGGVKDPNTGKITKYSWDAAKSNIKESFGFKRKRYSIDPKTGKAIKYNGAKSGYKVGDRWSFKDMFKGRKDGTGKQYIGKYIGLGGTDDLFYNSNVIDGMAKNPRKTVQRVSKLFGQLKPWQKVTKTVLDTSFVIDKVNSRITNVKKVISDVQVVFNNQESTWERVKSGVSTIDNLNSSFDFFNPADDAGEITGLIDEGLDIIDKAKTQFAT